MEELLLTEKQTLRELHDILVEHLAHHSTFWIYGNGKIIPYVPNNGDHSFWFDDLIVVILKKVKNGDQQIIDLSIKNNINLFEVKTRIKKK